MFLHNFWTKYSFLAYFLKIIFCIFLQPTGEGGGVSPCPPEMTPLVTQQVPIYFLIFFEILSTYLLPYAPVSIFKCSHCLAKSNKFSKWDCQVAGFVHLNFFVNIISFLISRVKTFLFFSLFVGLPSANFRSPIFLFAKSCTIKFVFKGLPFFPVENDSLDKKIIFLENAERECVFMPS